MISNPPPPESLFGRLLSLMASVEFYDPKNGGHHYWRAVPSTEPVALKAEEAQWIIDRAKNMDRNNLAIYYAQRNTPLDDPLAPWPEEGS